MTTTIQAYLLAETLRNVEEEAGAPQLDPDAEKQAIASAISFMERVYARAGKLAPGQGIDAAVRQTATRIRLISLIVAALFFSIGIGTTRALPEGYPAQANVVSLLAVLLLPNAASLLLWLGISVISWLPGKPDLGNGWLARRVLGLHTSLERLAHAGKFTRAASLAWRQFLVGTRAGRYRLTIVSHCFWLSLLLGALLGCWWLMVVRQVDFVWGSTLLAMDTVQTLFGTLTHWVSSFGFSVPDSNAVAASRIGTQLYDGELRRNWGIFILGAIMTLGMLPRFMAIIFDAAGLLYSGRNLKLNLAHPGYARLRPLLMPVSCSDGIIDADDSAGMRAAGTPVITQLSPDFPRNSAWLALDHPPGQPFTAIHGVADLGIVAAYDQQQQVSGRLAQLSPGWQSVCIYVDLGITPDRGMVRQLTSLIKASTQPVHLVLGMSTRAAAMPAADLQIRREDWLKAGLDAGLGIDRIHQYEQR